MSGQLDLQLESYAAEVGGQFVGQLTYSANPDKADTVRGLRVVLRYFTEGRGDTNSNDVWVIPVDVDSFGNATERFHIPVPPDGPISYDGRLIRLRWEVRATVDLARRRDYHSTVPVMILPVNGWGVYEYPHPLR